MIRSPESGFSFGEDNGTVLVSYAAAMAVPEIKTLSRANYSIVAKTKDEKTADALLEAMKSDARLSGVRVRSFRGGAGGVRQEWSTTFRPTFPKPSPSCFSSPAPPRSSFRNRCGLRTAGIFRYSAYWALRAFRSPPPS